MSPLVTIAIPAYKTEYLHEAITSALNQTYHNLELIIVDDCSPNDVYGVVSEFKDSRICYYRNEQNRGACNPAINWNTCLQYAKGEFFCLLCDDDAYEPTFVEELLQLAKVYLQCNVFRARVKIVDNNDNIISYFPSSPLWESCRDYIWHVSRKFRQQTISEWMYRTEHIKERGGYVNLPFAWGADYLSVYRFCMKDGIASVAHPLVSFRKSGINISTQLSKNALEKLTANFMREKMMFAFVEDNDLGHSVKQDIIRRKYYEDVLILSNIPLRKSIQIARCRKKLNIQNKAILKALEEKIILNLKKIFE